MSLKIRLRQQGKRNRLVYRLVLSDSRSPRDGKYIEMLGWYNPHENEEDKNLNVNAERILHWVNKGAELSDKAENLVKRGAPDVISQLRQKAADKRAKACKKRKSSRKKEAAVVA